MTASDIVAPAAGPTSSNRHSTRVRVPGKVILSGEHAVIYGAPALACAIQIYAFAAVTTSSALGVRLKVPEFGIDQSFSLLQLFQLAQQTQSRHRQYLTASGLLSSVVLNPTEFFAAALGASGLVTLLSDQHGLVIELSLDLIAGGGMGSSAALVAAMLAASFKHVGEPLTSAELVLKTTQSEHWQHGRSSGVDPYVCVMGGLQQYHKGYGERHVIKQLAHYFLVTTGKPKSSTGECVDAVKQQGFPNTLWQEFSIVQENMRTALQLNQSMKMCNAVKANHQLLKKIGVVPTLVCEFIDNIEAQGGAAKICGAGSVVGDLGGLVFVVGLNQALIEQLCLSYGYGVQAMCPDLQGVVYFE
ncbi:MAG: mevalonate kinase family protein [Pseudomonadales bacterium]|jgi:mevalonate kinase